MTEISKLRRIALNQQGLLKSNAFGRGKEAVLRAIEQLAYVQIDTISVVERAHHHVLWSRVNNYQQEWLERLVCEGQVFEYWFHAAAWLPMRDYRFALPRMQVMKEGRGHWGNQKDEKLMRNIIERIRIDGPLRTRDFEDTRLSKTQWWDHKPAKQALEQLFMQGDLMVSKRIGFQKVYDLTERVLPDHINTHTPSLAEYASYLVDTSLRAHGFAAPNNMYYLRKGKTLRAAIVKVLNERVSRKQLETIQLGDAGLVFIDRIHLEKRAPRSAAVVRILSPFDNLLIQRERTRAVFGYNYKIECYTPKHKREYGYFCLPILYRDQLVGRVDCKAHRKQKSLEVIAKYIECPVDERFPNALRKALHDFARFNQCDSLQFPKEMQL